ncbi:MAG: carbonic anhydrase [Acidimicrobiia bacterium]|nr:MAG: carbonic anhydrase [Acidimicrobiia bacterium]
MVRAAQAALNAPEISPTRRLAVVTCMDARVDPWRILRAGPGEINVIRNAGGVVTEDVIRSVFVSQRQLGTNKIMVLMHTDCGMEGADEGAIAAAAHEELGAQVDFPLGSFDEVHAELGRGVATLRNHPLITGTVTGVIYNVASDAVHTLPI